MAVICWVTGLGELSPQRKEDTHQEDHSVMAHKSSSVLWGFLEVVSLFKGRKQE